MKNRFIKSFVLLILVTLLSGCLYPENQLSKNKVPNEVQLKQMQSAIDTYQKETQGLLPIKTKPQGTPIFQKYLVDFNALKERNLISSIPGTAYENGGVYQYTIIKPEEDPTVKLLDLRVTDALREVNVRLEMYRNEHLYPPFGEEITDDVYTVDYKKLGYEAPPHVVSPYSQKNLPFVMDTNGKLYVDYRIDLTNALKEYEHNYKSGDDIRYLLTENTPFVPAYSLPYTIKDGEPVFMKQN
ncbi:hypothetical protein ACFO3D_04120 [Virgibacillus kekensis]|uniref:ABC transporter periplasmic binding protein yphF n=1 Tax=Virgibacillus kekensis TaxID=202261 RepID=A0ABV9DH37_9BACI